MGAVDAESRFRLKPSHFPGVVDADGPKGGPLEGAPLLAPQFNPDAGFVFFDHFDKFSPGVATSPAVPGDWIVSAATSGTAELVDQANGVVRLDTGGTADDRGPQIQKRGENFAPASGTRIHFEAKIKIEEVEKGQVFVGLATVDSTIFASGAITASEYIGFVIDAADVAAGAGSLHFQVDSALGSEIKESDVVTLDDDTFIRLGFIVQGDGSVDIFVNGAFVVTLTVGSMPAGLMTPSFAILNEATPTSSNYMDVDWVVCAVANAE